MFCFTAPLTSELYTLSLHDALPISTRLGFRRGFLLFVPLPFVVALLLTILFVMLLRRNDETLANRPFLALIALCADRKSTRLNSSHVEISYAVFCLKKKKIKEIHFV